ncbi:hypothetical protein BB560_000446 [Smittium megazygosporum]|uniref:DNA-directed RNA polymerase subunit beta n=1 Tax=Smittium megazygosporum TaxID=133381 RepID=A0A2T9ZKD0_9FUNG|nr:hypothetical protein BB560_000446 [Smittium megazygosporum]
MDYDFRTLDRQNRAINPTDSFEYPALQKLGAPHIDSFNRIWEESGRNRPPLIDLAVKDLGKYTIFDRKEEFTGFEHGNKLTYWIEDVQLNRPTAIGKENAKSLLVYPAECREGISTYKGKLTCKFCWQINDKEVHTELRSLGSLPIMVKSNRCNLYGMGPADLIKHHEEAEEFGGYFVVNGGEKVVRMLIAPKRNHVSAIKRPSYANRGPGFTMFATQIRCVREDQTSCTSTLHYLNTGNLMFRFAWYKQEYLVPAILVLKALCDSSDKEIFENLVQTDINDTFLKDQVELLLRSLKSYNANNKYQALKYLGSKFRVVMNLSEDVTDAQVGEHLIKKVVMVHLDSWKDKFNMLIFMIRKLYSLVANEIQPDNPDSMQNQELYLPGFLYLGIIKEKLNDILAGVRGVLNIELRLRPASVNFANADFFPKLLKKVNTDVGQKAQYFLATGNLVSKTGLDMQQTSGFCVVAEKLNFMRYLSHFQCVHRGSFFAELKTTAVRKLLPESWGFMCPVHTPDGAPCGLLNHLAHKCEVTTFTERTNDLERALSDFGVSLGIPSPQLAIDEMKKNNSKDSKIKSRTQYLSVQIDGKIVGFCSDKQSRMIANTLRTMRCKANNPRNQSSYYIPPTLEIGLVPKMNGGQYPGLYLFSNPARFTRPVKNIAENSIEYVSPFEQIYLEIACLNEDIRPGVTQYQEILPTHILSSVANLTPFCDFNQSPRNMYQCQMAKQTMGTPAQSLHHRADNKLYWLQTGQTPIVRPVLHDSFGVDGYPNGTNAVVAVLSYTGYDMEDAMILNKSAHERGFGYGSIYKTEVFDLTDEKSGTSEPTCHFMLGTDVQSDSVREKLDLDGLPFVGTPLVEGDPIIAFFDSVRQKTIIKKYKGEPGYVDTVRLVGSESLSATSSELQTVQITYRIPRSPVIGDKFSSRHGQKGVCSMKYPAIDLPFTESGMQPDVIINPHAFPSRMTIGMFVESLAGKSGALFGMAQDATPFQFDETNTAVDFFGEQLRAAGYNYYGNEPMYSGVTGKEMKADIYIGLVYYQRLRHMVNDKYQVRTVGPVDPLTHQPIKGRKRGGGIRLGEMERDSLLAHGTSYILQDRLMNCSDYSKAYVCRACGSMLAPISLPSTNLVYLDSDNEGDESPRNKSELEKTRNAERELLTAAATNAALSTANSSLGGKVGMDILCKNCKKSDITLVAIPYVLKYLATELASMNIKLNLLVK